MTVTHAQRRTRITVVSWTPDNARSRDLAAALDADLVLMPWAIARQHLVRRVAGWCRSTGATVRALRHLPRGSLVVVMCPPVFAPLVVVLLARRRALRVAVDAHSGTWNDDRWAWSHGLVTFVLRRVDLLIVTEPSVLALAGDVVQVTDPAARDAAVRESRVPALALHDPVAAPTSGGAATTPDDLPLVVFPASGAPDEPLSQLATAAELLHGQARIVATGRCGRPDGTALRTTGHLPRADYEQLLGTADLVLALSDREATMQRSAYEAVERGLPLVCSDTAVLRSTFADCAVFTDHAPEHLARSILSALDDGPRLSAASRQVAVRLAEGRRTGIALLQALAAASQEHDPGHRQERP